MKIPTKMRYKTQSNVGTTGVCLPNDEILFNNEYITPSKVLLSYSKVCVHFQADRSKHVNSQPFQIYTRLYGRCNIKCKQLHSKAHVKAPSLECTRETVLKEAANTTL